jgi:hypothetical protein
MEHGQSRDAIAVILDRQSDRERAVFYSSSCPAATRQRPSIQLRTES